MLIFEILTTVFAIIGGALLIGGLIIKSSKVKDRLIILTIVCFAIALFSSIICAFIKNDNLSKISRDETQIFMASNKTLYENNFENRELLALLIDKDVKKTTIRRVENKVLLTVYLMDNTNEIFFVSESLLNDIWWFEYHIELPDTDRIYIPK